MLRPCARSLALRVHKDALVAIRNFWGSLMHSSVRFRTLAMAVRDMDAAVKHADRVYK